MKRQAISSVLLLVFASSAMADWQTYSYPQDGFSVKLPSKPTSQTQDAAEGELHIPTTIYVSRTKDANYVVSVSKLPKGTAEQIAINFIEGIKTGFLRSTSGKATSDKPGTYAGQKGRLIHFVLPSKVEGSLWICRQGLSIYSLTIAGPGSNKESLVQQFYGSIKFR